MRPMFPGDMDHAVRALLAVPEPDQAGLAALILIRADTADRYRKRLHRAHPQHGTGSVISATGGMDKAALPDSCDRSYCAAMAVFIRAYLDHKFL